jgi:hypothetical protein
MRSGFPSLRALVGVAVLCLSLGACGFERNVADDCWIDSANFQSAERYLTGLRQRNLPQADPTRLASVDRNTRARKALRACQDDIPALGRSPIGGPATHEPAEGGHGA